MVQSQILCQFQEKPRPCSFSYFTASQKAGLRCRRYFSTKGIKRSVLILSKGGLMMFFKEKNVSGGGGGGG